jgi:hypothetical protein
MTERKKHLFHVPKIILAAVTLFVSACIVETAPGPLIGSMDRSLIEPRGELGQLVITRLSTDRPSEKSPRILVDGQEVTDGENIAKCYRGGVIIINLPAGEYEIFQTGSYANDNTTVNVFRGKRTYVTCGFAGALGFTDMQAYYPYTRSYGEYHFESLIKSENLKLTGIYDLE